MLLLFAICALLLGLPAAEADLAGDDVPPLVLPLVITICVLGIALLAFYFWPIYSTYYTLDPNGIEVKYGTWRGFYPWSDFEIAYPQKGMFSTRIGYPSISPCVRLTDGIVLRRKWRSVFFALYLTPNDTQAFMERISEFAPKLTRETMA